MKKTFFHWIICRCIYTYIMLVKRDSACAPWQNIWVYMYRRSYHYMRDQLFWKTSFNSLLWTSSPQTAHIYGPATCNNDQTWFKSTIRLHIHLHHSHRKNYCKHRQHVNITPPSVSDFWVGCMFLVWF